MLSKNTIAVVLVVAVALFGFAVPGVATAQDTQPGDPVVFEGTAQDETGDDIPEGTVIVLAVDGEEEDRINAQADGIFADPDDPDTGLATHTNAGDEVTFHIGSVDGPQADETFDLGDSQFDGGAFEEVDLTFPADSFDVLDAAELSLDGETDEITLEEGDSADATVTATFSESGDIELTSADDVDDEDLVDGVSFESSDGDVVTTDDDTFTVDAESAGDATVTVTVDGNALSESDSVDVEVVEEDDPPATGGAPPADDDEPDLDAEPPEPPADVDVELDETVEIEFDEETGSSTATFSEDSNVESITFRFETRGTVNARNLDREPDAIGPSPGASARVSQITVGEDLAGQPATLRMRVSFDRIDEIDADAEDLRINRYDEDAGEWEGLDTEIIGETETHVRLETEAPGFSYYSVSAVSEPEADIDAPDEVQAGDDVELDGSGSSDRYGEIVSYDWTADGESLSGETVTATLDEPGEVDIELTVTNDAGETDTVTQTIDVLEEEDDPEDPDDGISTAVILIVVALLLVLVVGGALYARSQNE